MKSYNDVESSRQSSNSIKVTIITAVFNADTYLNECILSVLNQTYDNIEYIIIDGGSTDKTVDIVKKYDSQLAHWTSEPDEGIYDAWNKGLAQATGQWIAFIGADDQLLPNAIEMYVHHISHHELQDKLEFVSSKIQLVNKDLSIIRVVGEKWNWKHFRHQMTTWHVGTFHSKHLFEKYGLFDSTFKISGDYELLLRPKDQLIASFVSEPTVMMRIGGVSDTNLLRASKETYRAKIKNNVLSLIRGRMLQLIDKFRLTIRTLTGWDSF